MFGIIRNIRGRTHRGRKHSVLRVNNDRCRMDMDGLVDRLAGFGMLDTYEYMDDYSGREEECMPEIRSMLTDAAGTDAAIGNIEEFLQNAEDEGWTKDDFESWGMPEKEIRRLLKDLKRHRSYFP